MIFQSVKGDCLQPIGESSYFNMAEVQMVISWVSKLIKSSWDGKTVCLDDIGIVSPYKKQCNVIRDELTKLGYGKITIGSAEVFQGQQRRIMFISTVRSGDDLGFVSDDQVNTEQILIG